jgi:hypothetical protein
MTRYKTKKLQWSNRLSVTKATGDELTTKDKKVTSRHQHGPHKKERLGLLLITIHITID